MHERYEGYARLAQTQVERLPPGVFETPPSVFQDNARYNEGSIHPSGEIGLADDKLFKAEYLGSGTFVISKPKRKKIKVRQSALKNPRRGSRK